MMDEREAAVRCRDEPASLSSEDKAYCASDAMKKLIASLPY